MAKKSFEKVFSEKLNNTNERVKTSFVLIRQDIGEMQGTVDAMRKYLKSKDKQYQYAKKEDNKIRDEFRRDINEFTQKISQLKLALSAVRDIQKEVVAKKDLAQIEDGIKTSFKNEINGYKEEIKDLKKDLREADRRLNALENGKVIEKKKGWFFKKKEE